MSNQNEIMDIIKNALKSNDKYDEIIKFASKFDEFTALRDQMSKEGAHDENDVGFSLYFGDYSEKAVITIIEDWVRMKQGNTDTELAELRKANADLREENIELKEILDKLEQMIWSMLMKYTDMTKQSRPNFADWIIRFADNLSNTTTHTKE